MRAPHSSEKVAGLDFILYKILAWEMWGQWSASWWLLLYIVNPVVRHVSQNQVLSSEN